MLKLKINNNWRISADGKQFLLQKRGKDSGNVAKDDTEQWITQAYCPTLEVAINEYSRHQIMHADIRAVETLLGFLAELAGEIEQALMPDFKVMGVRYAFNKSKND